MCACEMLFLSTSIASERVQKHNPVVFEIPGGGGGGDNATFYIFTRGNELLNERVQH